MSNSIVLQDSMRTFLPAQCKIFQEKVDSARQAGVTDIKTINVVEKDNFMRVFNFPEDVYDSAWAQATGEEDPASSGDTSD